jgi:acetolactate synthase-1/3 small subunit
MEKFVLSLLVDNNPGVASRISGLFSRRSYNMESLSSGITADPRFERVTIVVSADEQNIEQIEKQLLKLEDVRDIKRLENGTSVTRELMLVKIRAKDTERQAIMNVTDIFHGRIVDVSKDSMIVELTGKQDKLDGFLNLLAGYEILELARTGMTGLTRGSENVTFLD